MTSDQPNLWEETGPEGGPVQGVNHTLKDWLNEAQADRQARWEGRLRRGQALREELRLARAAGKAARHADRLRRIAAATREE